MANEVYISDNGVDGNVTGAPVALWHNDVQSFSFHVLWADSLAGTLTVEASNDPLAMDDPANADWVDISSRFTTIPTITGVTGNGLIDGTLGGFACVRLVFTHSGDGSLYVWLNVMRRLNAR